jgi:hypothetical protein
MSTVMDELLELEAALSTLIKTVSTEPQTHHSLTTHTSSLKDLVKRYLAKSQEARATTAHSSTELVESQERFRALQADYHRAVTTAQRASIGATTRARPPTKPPTSDPADSYAADITTQLQALNQNMKGHVDTSAQNVAVLERSVQSVRTLAGRYKAFEEVSGVSRRLVGRHAAKKRRDLMAMKAAIAVFLLVCLVIVVIRLRVFFLLVRLLIRVVGVAGWRRARTADIVVNEQPPIIPDNREL